MYDEKATANNKRYRPARHFICFTLTLSLIISVLFIPTGNDSYSALAAPAATTSINFIQKDGTTATLAELDFDASSKTLYFSGTSNEPDFMNKGFSNYDTYNAYGVIVYSGLNKVNPRLAVVDKGFTLDSLKEYIEQETGIPIATDSKISIKAADTAYQDVSNVDDAPRYYYPSYLMWPTMSMDFVDGEYGTPIHVTNDPEKKKKAFQDDTRSETPVVFAVNSYMEIDIGSGSNILDTQTKLDNAIQKAKQNMVTDDSLRMYKGQLPYNDREETLGSNSIRWINNIRITPAYHSIENGNVIVSPKINSKYATDEVVMISGSAVSISKLPVGMTPTSAGIEMRAVNKATGAFSKITYNETTKEWSFKMPSGYEKDNITPSSAVLVCVCPISFNANGGTLSGLSTLFLQNGFAYGKLPTATRKGYIFDGWWTGPSGGTKITDTSIVDYGKVKTLYARWTKEVSLSTSKISKIGNYQYSGKAIKPNPKVYVGNKKLTKGTHYTVSYSKNKTIGQASIKITAKPGSGYSGSKTAYFKIIPKKNSISKLTVGKKKVTVKFNKVSSAQKVTNYQIRYLEKGKSKYKYKNLSIKSGGAKTATYTIKNLPKGKKYKVSIRGIKTVNVSGKKAKFQGPWSNAKTSAKVR